MIGFEPLDAGRRREEIERSSRVVGEREERRLSRELEEGFRDDSDEDEEDPRRRSLSRGRVVL